MHSKYGSFGAQSCVCLGLVYVSLQESLHVAFDAARVYSQTMEHFRLFCKENESVDLDAVQRHDHGDVLYIHVKMVFITHFLLTTKNRVTNTHSLTLILINVFVCI